MSSVMKRLAFVGDMNLIRSLDRISAISVGFFLVKPTRLGLRVMDLGSTCFLGGGVANRLELCCRGFCDIISFENFRQITIIYIDKSKSLGINI